MPSVTIEANDLVRAVAAAKNVVAGRSTIPIYECVKLSAGVDGLLVSAVASDHGVETLVPCHGQGAWVLNFVCLAAFTGSLPKGGQVTISGDRIATLRCGTITARIQSLDFEDFPEFGSKPEFGAAPTWSNGFFSTLLTRLAACCLDRPEFLAARAIRVKVSATQGRGFAMNGYVLARQDFVTEAACELDLAIDMTTAPIVASLFEKGPLWLAQSGSVLWLTNGLTTYRAKTVEVSHPEVFSSLEFVEGPTLSADADSMLRAIRSLAPITSDKVRRVLVNVTPAGAFIGARDSQSVMCLPFDCEGDGEMQRFIDADFIRAMLTAAASDTVQFGMRDKFSNGQGTETLNFKGNGFFGLIVPLRVNAEEVESVASAWQFQHREQAVA